MIGTVDNDKKILKIAEEYYNNMEEAYRRALEMNKTESLQYYRKKMLENKTTNFTMLIPDWLRICIDNTDATNIEIIKKNL
jgi:ribosomal protein L20